MLWPMISWRRKIYRMGAASFVLGMALLSLAPAAQATVARALNLSRLVASSGQVVVGSTLSSASAWENVGGQRRIVSYARVRVTQAVLGTAKVGDELRIRTLGGRVGDIGQVVLGSVKLRKGEESLLFLYSRAGQPHQITAMSQGHYPVRLDANGERRVAMNLSGLELLGEGQGAASLLDGMRLTQAISMIRSAKDGSNGK